MRIALGTIIILLGANILVSVLNSDMTKMMKERNEQICKLQGTC
jgi:hypothetical protein